MSTSNLDFRELRRADAAAWLNLRRAMAELPGSGSDEERARERSVALAEVERDIGSDHRLVRVIGAFRKNTLLGAAWVGDTPDTPPGQVMAVRLVGVLPSMQRRGIGKELVLRCVKFAKWRQATGVLLKVLHGNEPAVALYKAAGFEDWRTDDYGVELVLKLMPASR